MERRRQSAARNRTRSVKNPAAQKNSALVPASLPNIAELIAYGEITIGVLRPVGCVATASDEDRTLAMLVRRRGETWLSCSPASIKPSTKHSPKTSTLTKSTRLEPFLNSNCHILPSRTLRMTQTRCQHGLLRTLTAHSATGRGTRLPAVHYKCFKSGKEGYSGR